MPPYPKPAAQRRRVNKVPGAQKLAADPAPRPAPPLPGAASLLASTRKWWKVVWASPMAAVYVEADVPALLRLAQLVDASSRDQPSATLLAEIRQLEDRFGLSPLARRRLQWEIDLAGGDRAVGAPAESQSERWLRVAS